MYKLKNKQYVYVSQVELHKGSLFTEGVTQ